MNLIVLNSQYLFEMDMKVNKYIWGDVMSRNLFLNDCDKVWYCDDEDDCDDYDEVNQVECFTVHDTIVWYGHLIPHTWADQSKHNWKRKYQNTIPRFFVLHQDQELSLRLSMNFDYKTVRTFY